MFTSDNGFFHGEHRVPFGKLLPYEPSIRVPLIVRGPGVPRGQRRAQLVENIDLAPTILEAARAKGDPILPSDGRSLFPLLRDRGLEWGRDLLIAARGGAVRYWALRTYRYLYVEYSTGELELYDLDVDPYEERSVHADPRYSRVVRVLEARLARATGLRGRVLQRHAAARAAGGAEQLRRACRARHAARARRPVPGGGDLPGGPPPGGAGAAPVAGREPTHPAAHDVDPGQRFRLRVRARLIDGRIVTLDRKLRTCLPGQRRGKRPAGVAPGLAVEPADDARVPRRDVVQLARVAPLVV